MVRPYSTDTDEESAKELLKAACEGDAQSVVSQLERPVHPDVEAVDRDGGYTLMTPLQVAAARGHLEVAR